MTNIKIKALAKDSTTTHELQSIATELRTKLKPNTFSATSEIQFNDEFHSVCSILIELETDIGKEVCLRRMPDFESPLKHYGLLIEYVELDEVALTKNNVEDLLLEITLSRIERDIEHSTELYRSMIRQALRGCKKPKVDRLKTLESVNSALKDAIESISKINTEIFKIK